MIYALLFWEFFQIGLFAVGGGLVTIPFLFNLAAKYPWFDAKELTDMIAVSQSTPGPVGINMATYAGFKAAGIWGSIAATLSLVLPSMIVVYFVAKILDKWSCNPYVQRVLGGIKPAVLALILFAGLDLAKVTVIDYKSLGLLVALTAAMRLYKKNAVFYIVISAVIGLILRI
jgi:chromate transporter